MVRVAGVSRIRTHELFARLRTSAHFRSLNGHVRVQLKEEQLVVAGWQNEPNSGKLLINCGFAEGLIVTIFVCRAKNPGIGALFPEQLSSIRALLAQMVCLP